MAAANRRISNSTVAALACAAFAAGVAQPPAHAAEGTRASISASPYWLGDTSLDRGGSASMTGLNLNAGVSRRITPKLGAGLDLSYELEDWSFDAPVAFGRRAPWGTIHRSGISVPLSYRSSPEWNFSLAPTLAWSREDGASWGDSRVYGGLFSATRSFGNDLTLGAGFGLYRRVGETRAFPYLAVNWQINDRLRLGNPFRAGPAGPAGLELAYSLGNDWEVAAGGAYRSQRFRLDDSGATPSGIGETRGVPLFLRLSRRVGYGLSFDAYAGAVLGSKLTLRNAAGQELGVDDQGTVPMVGFTFSGRF